MPSDQASDDDTADDDPAADDPAADDAVADDPAADDAVTDPDPAAVATVELDDLADDGDGAVAVDDVDRRVLEALQADGRLGAVDLSAAAGVPTATATDRRERLEAAGVVEGYRAVVDDAVLGHDVTAVFRLVVDPASREAVLATLEGTGRTVSVYEVTGDADVVAVGKFVDTGDLDGTVKRLLAHDGVEDVETDVVREVVVEDDSLPVGDGEE